MGISKNNKPIKIIKIHKKIEFKNDDKFISIEPSKLSLDIDFELKYQNQIIGSQRNNKNVYFFILIFSPSVPVIYFVSSWILASGIINVSPIKLLNLDACDHQK